MACGLALGAPFTYQGPLSSGGQPAKGTFDLKVGLYGGKTGGAQQCAVVTLTG